MGYSSLKPSCNLTPCSGIIYSDIGTVSIVTFHDASSSTDIRIQSPLYVLNGIWQTTPSPEDVVGGISAIIWALTLLPLLKYVSVLADEVLHV